VSQEGIESAIPMSVTWTIPGHPLDRAVTVIGVVMSYKFFLQTLTGLGIFLTSGSNVTMRRVRVTFAAVESAIIIILYSEWAFLALIIQLAKRMRRIILSFVVCTFFPTLSYKEHLFHKNNIEYKMSETFSF